MSAFEFDFASHQLLLMVIGAATELRPESKGGGTLLRPERPRAVSCPCFRRQTVRYERRTDIHQAFLPLASSPICWSYVQRRLCQPSQSVAHSCGRMLTIRRQRSTCAAAEGPSLSTKSGRSPLSHASTTA